MLAGLGDDHDIKTLCNLLVIKLLAIDAAGLARHLDALADRLQATLAAKLKDTAVKQEIEKATEATRDALRTSVLVQDVLGGGGAAPEQAGPGERWAAYWEYLAKEHAALLKVAEAEVVAERGGKAM